MIIATPLSPQPSASASNPVLAWMRIVPGFISSWFRACRSQALLVLLGSAALIHASESFAAAQSASRSNLPAGSPWTRIVLIGASATAGMIDPAATNALCGLAPYLEAALRVPHEPLQNLSSRLFFFGPQRSGKIQIEKALAHEPSLVVGVDFLFWYCYGDVSSETERLRRLEEGLDLLGRIKCPLILGDIPDASAAADGMLRPAQIPAADTIAAANRRINQWVAARKHTGLVALDTFMRTARHSHSLQIRNRHWSETKSLLQQDKLHPSASGAVALTLAILEQVLLAHTSATEEDMHWDLQEIVAEPGPRTIPSIITDGTKPD